MANRLRWSGLGCVAVVIAAAMFASLLMTKAYRNTSSAMAPTIGVGDLVYFWKTRGPARDDIVAFDYPPQPSTVFIKRVVGMPGDVVEIRDKRLLINGAPQDESFAVHEDAEVFQRDPRLPEPYRSRDQYGPYRIAPDTFFVLGDNRDRSSDSRYWGTVPRKNMRGVAVMILSPTRGFRVP